ncbi:MAG: serine hydrolase [Saprospiraceae bacterium]
MKRQTRQYYPILFLLFFICHTSQISAQFPAVSTEKKINDYVANVMERHEIPGVGLAIIKDGKVMHQKNYGYANLEHSVPISDKSIFRVYSLTKLFVATGVFQLIEQNKLSLEDVISDYVSDLPATWNDVQIKHLLTHSSGLPDMSPFYDFSDLSEKEAKEKVFAQPLQFPKGATYRYNQTNFWLLQLIIEKITQQPFEDFILQNQFDKKVSSASRKAFFSSDSRDIIANRCTPYFCFRTGVLMIDHSYIGPYMHSSNGMNITLNEYIAWDEKMRNNEIISSESHQAMLSKFMYKNDDKKFTYGWKEQDVNGRTSYGFTGSLVTAYRIFPKENLSIIFLSNGLGNIFDIEDIVNYLAGLVSEELIIPESQMFETLLQASLKNNINGFKEVYLDLKKDKAYQKIDFESQINSVGYMHLNLKKVDTAIRIFKLNIQEFPTQWNVYDSYAEALESNGNIKEALANYSKALKLNVNNQYDYNDGLTKKIKYLKEQLEAEK